MKPSLLAILSVVALCGCRPQAAPEVERRIPVDVVGDCVALRQRISECKEEFVEVFLQRRALDDSQKQPPQKTEAAQRQAVLEDLDREAGLSPEERRNQCRVATAEIPPPRPEDVASLHRCLPLSCAQRASCLRPLLFARKR